MNSSSANKARTGHEIAMRVRAAYWSIHRRTQACLTRSGVTADQFVILSLLAEEDGVTQQELVRRAYSDHNTVRPMLVLLEKRRLLVRRSHPSDGRAYCIELTPEGRRTFEELTREIRPLQKGLSELFDVNEAGALADSLERIRAFALEPEVGDSGPTRAALSATQGKG